MAHRVVRSCFEKFQQARMDFVTEAADMASKPHYIDALQEEGIMRQLRPLLNDETPSVQQTAALALGRLANYSVELAEEVVSTDILPALVQSFESDNVSLRASCAAVEATYA